MNTPKILAKVGAVVITEADVNATIEALGPRGQGYNSPEGRRAVLDQLVAKNLFLAEAKKNFYEADPKFKADLAKVKEEMLANFAIEKALSLTIDRTAPCCFSCAAVTSGFLSPRNPPTRRDRSSIWVRNASCPVPMSRWQYVTGLLLRRSASTMSRDCQSAKSTSPESDTTSVLQVTREHAASSEPYGAAASKRSIERVMWR